MSDRTGWIYVLDDQMGHFKIGRARQIDARIKTLRIQLPFPVEIAFCCETNDCIAAERQLHHTLRECRLNGEWFALEDWHFGIFAAVADGRMFCRENGKLIELPPVDIDEADIQVMRAVEMVEVSAQ